VLHQNLTSSFSDAETAEGGVNVVSSACLSKSSEVVAGVRVNGVPNIDDATSSVGIDCYPIEVQRSAGVAPESEP